MKNYNYIRINRKANRLTQTELIQIVNYNLSESGSLYRLSQSRLSYLERLDERELLSKLNVLEYKQLKTVFGELEKVKHILVD